MNYRKSLAAIVLVVVTCFGPSPLEAGKKRTPRRTVRMAAPTAENGWSFNPYGVWSKPVDPLSTDPGDQAMLAHARAWQEAHPIPPEWKGITRFKGIIDEKGGLDGKGGMRLVPAED